MNRQSVYRAALRLIPPGGAKAVRVSGAWGEEGRDRMQVLTRILGKHRTVGAALFVFDGSGRWEHIVYGDANRGVPVRESTHFRLASISKLLTALCVLKLKEEGRADLDEDISRILPYPVRHPGAPGRSITLRMLLNHSSGLRDGKAYEEGMRRGLPVTQVLAGDSFSARLPGEGWEYSNLGAGLAACVLEAKTGLSFETLMRQTLFGPLGVPGTFYPQRVPGPLADAWRVLPPGRHPAFDAEKRRQRPCPDAGEPRPERHYLLAQGACCAPAQTVAACLKTLMEDGFLSDHSRRLILDDPIPFGPRLPGLFQGLGISRFHEDAAGTRSVIGHQGHAYGAVHGAFLDAERRFGMVFLSSGTSEARRGFMADVNLDLIRFVREAYWTATA